MDIILETKDLTKTYKAGNNHINAVDHTSICKFNPKELGEYWESLKNFRDWYSVMSTQLKKGREEGLKEGLEQGRRKNASRMQKK